MNRSSNDLPIASTCKDSKNDTEPAGLPAPAPSSSLAKNPALNSAPTPRLRPEFWRRYALEELTHAEWEALCDGCGSCCLVKFLDPDEPVEDVEYTDVACHLLDCATGHCRHYAERQHYVPDCMTLTPQNMPMMMWLPSTCAYKRIYLGQDLPTWHLLVTGDEVQTRQGMQAAGVGVAGRCVTEAGMDDWTLEQRTIKWVKA